MASSPSDLTVAFLDHGLFVSLARHIGRNFKKAYYTPSWKVNAPSSNSHDIGKGVGNLERVDDVWGLILPDLERILDPDEHDDDGYLKDPSVDLFVVLDLYFTHEVQMLRKMGYRVWGAGAGEELEVDRIGAKAILKEHGVPVGPYTVWTGMDDLESYLKTHPGRHYIKLGKTRADGESQECLGWKYIQPWLRDMRYELGNRAHTYKFLVEKGLDGVIEAALDCYNIYGQIPDRALQGVEEKDQAYCGIFTDNLNSQFTEVYRALAPWFKAKGCCSFTSIESLIDEDAKPWITDPAIRPGLPSGAAQCAMYGNVDKIVLAGAGGVLVQPTNAGKWVVELMLLTGNSKRHPVHVPKELEEHVFLVNCWKSKPQDYEVMPQPHLRAPEGLATLGSVVAIGKTMEAAGELAHEYAQEIMKGSMGIEVSESALDAIEEKFEKLAERGCSLE